MELTQTLPTLSIPNKLGLSDLLKLRNDLEKISQDDESIILMRGEQPGQFCQGMDLDIIVENSDAGNGLQVFADILTKLRYLPKTVIAIVEGDTLGGGIGIATAADSILATQNARFGLPEGIFGLAPAIIWPILLERLTSQKLRTWALSAETLSAAEARGIGLVDACIAPDELEPHIKKMVRQYSRCSKQSISIIKKELSVTGEITRQIAHGAALTEKRISSPEVKACIQAWQQGEIPWKK